MIRSLLLFTMMASCYASIVSDAPVWRQILEEQPSSVLLCTSEKLYLRAEKIEATERGLFLKDADSAIGLPFVCSDGGGCFVPLLSKPAVDYWVCWNLECTNYGGIWHGSSKCPTCGKPGSRA